MKLKLLSHALLLLLPLPVFAECSLKVENYSIIIPDAEASEWKVDGAIALFSSSERHCSFQQHGVLPQKSKSRAGGFEDFVAGISEFLVHNRAMQGDEIAASQSPAETRGDIEFIRTEGSGGGGKSWVTGYYLLPAKEIMFGLCAYEADDEAGRALSLAITSSLEITTTAPECTK